MSTLDNTNDENNSNNNNLWWWSPEAYAIKFAILASIFVIFVAYFLGGYLHAQRRIKKGLPPLAYHRWLLSRAQRAPFEPHLQQQFQYAQVQQDGYAMHGYPAPPPAYNPNAPPPPSYQAPPVGPKPIPSQNVYAAPAYSGETSSNANLSTEEAAQPKPRGGFLSRFKH